MKTAVALIAVAACLGISAPAYAGKKSTTTVEQLVQGPPFIEVVSPYANALKCLADHQTPEQKAVTYGILSFPDKTARVAYAPDNAAGAFMSQGMEDMLVTSFKSTGVQVVDISPQYRQFFDWSTHHMGGGRISLMLPDIVVVGSLNSLDFLPGGGIQLDGALKAGGRENRINISFDARATTTSEPIRNPSTSTPGPWYNPDNRAAHVIASFAYGKQIVQYGNEFGASGFLGGGATRTFLQLDWGKSQREALQYAEHAAADVVAWRTVRDITGITACDEAFTNAIPGITL